MVVGKNQSTDKQNSPEYECNPLSVSPIEKERLINGLRQWNKKTEFGIQFINKLYMKAGKPRIWIEAFSSHKENAA